MTNNAKQVSGIACGSGHAAGPVLATDTALSFWGGVDPALGKVIDRHHPLCGEGLKGRILTLPGGRGSCSGSGVLLEMLVNGQGPAAIVTRRADDIIALGVLIAQEMFGASIPVLILDPVEFDLVSQADHAWIDGNTVAFADQPFSPAPIGKQEPEADLSSVSLTDQDRAMLDGASGRAAQVAMKIIVRMAGLMGAGRLMDVAQVHIDGCVYTGQASLTFAQKLGQMGGRVAVPTTLNAISVDYRHWQAQGVDPVDGGPAAALADAYLALGAEPSFTCAPYLLDTAPVQGEQIAWAESNAVMYANSVLGARTLKYPDFLDACIALTGRAPATGTHITENRRASMLIGVDAPDQVNDGFWPLAGYAAGRIAGDRIAAVGGLAHLSPDRDDLKAFSAAYATTSSAPMFHMIGVTPEAADLVPEDVSLRRRLTADDLADVRAGLDQAGGRPVDLVSLGNPHFSLTEFEKLSALCAGRQRNPATRMVVTAGRDVVGQAAAAGFLQALHDFGVTIVTDTCWCMIGEPVIPPDAKVIMTNSAKYAHYGPGITGRTFGLASLAACVRAVQRGGI